MNIEPGKFYRTREGRKVRIYATDGEGPYKIHGAVFVDGEWVFDTWLLDGTVFADRRNNDDDIIAKWIEPHPLANAKPGDPIWVRDAGDACWVIKLFSELNEGAPANCYVAATSRTDFGDLSFWRYGKPYIPGEAP